MQLQSRSSSLALALALAGLTACSTTTVTRTALDGTQFKATNQRALWKSQGVDVRYTVDTNGVITATARIDQSGTDAEAIKAAVEGAVQAAVKAATGK